jgi:hypothetical protein
MHWCELTCPWCDSKFVSTRNAGKFCSLKCSIDSRILVLGENECWPWQGGIFLKDGYGRVSWDHTSMPAHRAAYQVHVDSVPRGSVVRHSCDNPICCNYKKHLLVGTVKQNVHDAVERNLHPIGERQSGAKLTDFQVRVIRSMAFEILSYEAVAHLLGCHLSSIFRAYRRKLWRHVA